MIDCKNTEMMFMMYNFVYNKQNALTICLMSSEYTKEKIG